jgi:exosortase D (VPLPA-CTERM-specific)
MELSHYKNGWINSPMVWGVIGVSTLMLVYGFWHGIVDMISRWNESEEYGFAYFLPVISAYLIWQRRDRLAQLPFQPTWIGVIIILSAGFLFFLGEIATTFALVQYALLLTIYGFALALMGWRAFSVILGPLALLFFMIPLPKFIYFNLSSQLQLLSSQLGVEVIRLFDISVYLEGNVIDLGEYKLQVVDACSGLRYLFPLVSLAFIAAYLFRVAFWKKAIVFLSSVPITIFMNSFRIGVIGVLVNTWGQEQADGFLHYFEGWVVFMACIAILILEMMLLNLIGRDRRRFSEVFGLEFPKPFQDDITFRKRPISSVHYGIIGAVALIVIASIYIKVAEEVRPERMTFNHFPLQVGDWNGSDDKLQDFYLDALKLDDYLLGDYYNPSGEMVNFYVAYYASQQAGSAAHSPRTCIPGGGWRIGDAKEIELPGLKMNHQPVHVNRLVIKRGEFKQLVYYWFQQRGRSITNEWLVKWYLFQDALTMHRTDGALIRLTTLIKDGEDWNDGDRRLSQFAEDAIPVLEGYLPE